MRKKFDKRLYTYEEWLKNIPYFKYSDPDILKIPNEELTEEQLMEFLRNSEYWLYTHGYLPESEFQKIISAQREAFKTVVSFFIEKIPAFISSYLKKEPDVEFAISNRIKTIDDHFDHPDSRQIISDIISSQFPVANVNGKIFQDIVNNGNITPYLPRFYQNGQSPLIYSVLPRRKRKHPHPFLLNSVLYEERRLLAQQLTEFEITTTSILERFLEEKASKTESDAYDEVYDWLIHQLGYTEDSVRQEFGITLSFDALRKRAARHQKSKLKKRG